MPIKRLTPKAEIDRFIAARIEAINNALVYNMCAIGEQVVNHARSLPSPNAAAFRGSKVIPPHQPHYMDWTDNLRSSIGYVIAIDGKIVQMSSFDVVKNGGKGATEGKEFALQLIKDYPQGIVLIVVAGMNYATYVSAKGYDVLDSSELLAEKLVPQMLKKLGIT